MKCFLFAALLSVFLSSPAAADKISGEFSGIVSCNMFKEGKPTAPRKIHDLQVSVDLPNSSFGKNGSITIKGIGTVEGFYDRSPASEDGTFSFAIDQTSGVFATVLSVGGTVKHGLKLRASLFYHDWSTGCFLVGSVK